MKDIPSSNISYKSFGGGPHNLGNPDDKSLRKVEKEILIPQKMRDRAKEEKCIEEVKNFTECCKDSSIVMPFKCRNQNTALKDCLALWYNDPKFKEECTLDYLEERSEYRRTGIPKRAKAARMASS